MITPPQEFNEDTQKFAQRLRNAVDTTTLSMHPEEKQTLHDALLKLNAKELTALYSYFTVQIRNAEAELRREYEEEGGFT